MAMDVPTAMSVCDKRGPGVIVSGVSPPIPIDEWQVTMDPREVEEFRTKWKKDMGPLYGSWIGAWLARIKRRKRNNGYGWGKPALTSLPHLKFLWIWPRRNNGFGWRRTCLTSLPHLSFH